MSHKAAKQLLRKHMKDKIKMMTTEEKQRQSVSVCSKLLGRPCLLGVQSDKLIYLRIEGVSVSQLSGTIFKVHSYMTPDKNKNRECLLSMDDEINTDRILTHVLSSNKKCFIPR